ncbi:MAG: amino acid ABC transporter permease [Anaerolineae bacterium]|nr:amino acid ABC transporter permease [Anaerolineae bacterium]
MVSETDSKRLRLAEDVPIGTVLEATSPAKPRPVTPFTYVYRFPWWILFLVVMAIFILLNIAGNPEYSGYFRRLWAGVSITMQVSLGAYGVALIIGLLTGIVRSYPPKPGQGIIGGIINFIRLIIYHIVTLYVEILRGMPIATLLVFGAFAFMPALRQAGVDIPFRGTSVETAIIFLGLAYGAFLSEVFRAGIQSIPKGQLEAARSLGMKSYQTIIYIVIPQAIKVVIPPLGNDFIAMIKDSSLVMLLALNDVTQLAKKISGSNFDYVDVYLVVAFIYLSMTLTGSLFVKLLVNELVLVSLVCW